jgi:predicted TIM-barrel fold metal-dependent hydrolase
LFRTVTLSRAGRYRHLTRTAHGARLSFRQMDKFSRRVRDSDDQALPLPLPPGPVSNGEFLPAPPGVSDRSIESLIRGDIDEASRRLGLDRRIFLQTAGAVAASLAAFGLAGCSTERASRGTSTTPGSGSSGSTSSTTKPGGTYTVPPSTDKVACEEALNGTGEFIFDVHTHHVMPAGPWTHYAPETVGLVLGMLPSGCSDNPALDCVDRANYLHDMFLASDTTMAMLTDVPNSGSSDAPVPFPQELATQQVLDDLTHGGANRLLVQKVIAPNVGPLGACLDEMTAAAETGRVAAFKVYTAWSPTAQGYSLEDRRIGLPTVQHAHDLGVKVFVAHKGLPLVNFDPAFNHPDDVVALSRQFPDMNFVIYHSAWDPSQAEGPYDPASTVGIDSLLTALDHHKVPPNSNVWVDIAAMWRQLLTVPDQAAHALGKVLSRVGEKRVMWGTDAIWYGSPQPQIMAMRAFQITAEYQAAYGYPALTNELKAAIFGLNAARLFGVDPTALRCGLTSDPITAGRPEAASLRVAGALPSPWGARGPTTRRQVLTWLARSGAPWSPI